MSSPEGSVIEKVEAAFNVAEAALSKYLYEEALLVGERWAMEEHKRAKEANARGTYSDIDYNLRHAVEFYQRVMKT